jgi:hypothetical protein
MREDKTQREELAARVRVIPDHRARDGCLSVLWLTCQAGDTLLLLQLQRPHSHCTFQHHPPPLSSALLCFPFVQLLRQPLRSKWDTVAGLGAG